MNETPSSQSAPETPTGFFPWLRSLGIVRRTDDRWFAGVASGIAQRVGIDPLIIRGAFIVLAVIGGPGILLYIAAWLLLPDRAGKIHLEELFQGRATTAVTVVMIIVAVWIFGAIFGNLLWPNLAFWNWDAWGFLGLPRWVSITFTVLFWVGLTIVGAFVAHRLIMQHGTREAQRRATEAGQAPQQGQPAQPSQPARPSPEQAFFSAQPAPPTQAPASQGQYESHQSYEPQQPHSDQHPQQAGTAQDFSERMTNWSENFSEKATEWSNNVTDKANEWSTQYVEHHEHTNMGSGQRILTFAFAFLAAGVAALWFTLSGLNVAEGLATTAPGIFFAAVLAATVVFALSMVLAGARGKQSGSIGFFGFVGVITLIVTSVLPWGSILRLIGQNHAASESSTIVTILGETHLDLSDVNLKLDDTAFDITQGLGNVHITVPKHLSVELHLSSIAGQMSIEGTNDSVRRDGVFNVRVLTLNDDGGAPDITVTVRLLAGNIDIEEARGSALGFAPATTGALAR